MEPPEGGHDARGLMSAVFQRRTTGSVVCPSCGSLVGVRDDKCYTCGRSNPGLWGFGPALRHIGADFGFGPVVVGACVTIWVVTLLLSGSNLRTGNIMSSLSPSTEVLNRVKSSLGNFRRSKLSGPELTMSRPWQLEHRSWYVSRP